MRHDVIAIGRNVLLRRVAVLAVRRVHLPTICQQSRDAVLLGMVKLDTEGEQAIVTSRKFRPKKRRVGLK